MIRSGQTEVATAGTAVQVNASDKVFNMWLRSHPDNTGDIFIGQDSTGADVSATSGLALAKTDPPITYRGRLSDLYVDAEQNGDKLTWMVYSIE